MLVAACCIPMHVLHRISSSLTFHLRQARRFLLACSGVSFLGGCSPEVTQSPSGASPQVETVWLQVGTIEVRESDLLHHLDLIHSGRRDPVARQKALEELGRSAQLVQAALESEFAEDPVVRSEVARVLGNRVKEKLLHPELKRLSSAVPEQRLRELYDANKTRYQANEKRQLAVLWLDPGKDPQRSTQYQERLAAARSWFFENAELSAQPDKGFAELAIDYSEHQASRFSGGVVGWLEQSGGMDAWTRAVADIGFALESPGEVSEVMTRPEGLFLVRFMAQTPAVTRPFESVATELQQLEVKRLKEQAEADFWANLAAKHPVQRPAISADENSEAAPSQEQ